MILWCQRLEPIKECVVLGDAFHRLAKQVRQGTINGLQEYEGKATVLRLPADGDELDKQML